MTKKRWRPCPNALSWNPFDRRKAFKSGDGTSLACRQHTPECASCGIKLFQTKSSLCENMLHLLEMGYVLHCVCFCTHPIIWNSWWRSSLALAFFHPIDLEFHGELVMARQQFTEQLHASSGGLDPAGLCLQHRWETFWYRAEPKWWKGGYDRWMPSLDMCINPIQFTAIYQDHAYTIEGISPCTLGCFST